MRDLPTRFTYTLISIAMWDASDAAERDALLRQHHDHVASLDDMRHWRLRKVRMNTKKALAINAYQFRFTWVRDAAADY